MGNIGNKLLEKNDESYLTQYLAAITASITFITAGIYQGWPGPSLVKIISDEYPNPVSQEEASYIAIIGSVGHVIGGILSSCLADSIGRKITLLCIGIPQVISFILIFFATYSTSLLFIARVLGGIGEGATIALVPSYVAEIVVPKVRGVLGGFTTVYIGVGTLFINIIGSYMTIEQAALVCLIFPLMFLITFLFMPESPYYYLMKKNTEAATSCLKILRRKTDVDKEISQLILDVERQMSEKGTFKDLFYIKTNRKVFFLVTALRIFQLFTGYGAFISYSQLMIAESTNLSPVLGSSLLILAGLIMMCAGSFYLDKVGKRPLFIISIVLSFVALISMAIFLTLRDYTSIDVSSVSYMPLVFILFYNIVFSGGLGVGVNIFIAEIYSTSIKAKGLSVGSVVFAIGVTGSIKLYQYTADYIGIAVPFYIFAASSFLGIWFFYFAIPETKGKTLEIIQQELKRKRKERPGFNN